MGSLHAAKPRSDGTSALCLYCSPQDAAPCFTSLTLCFPTQQFPFFTLFQAYSYLGVNPAHCRTCPCPLCFHQAPHHKADAGGVVQPRTRGPAASLFPAPSARLISDIAVPAPGSSQAIFRCLSVPIWVSGGTSLSPRWVQMQPVAMAWTCLHVAGQPGSSPGWSFPGRARLLGRASHPAASVVVAVQCPLARSEQGRGHPV